MDKKLAPEVAGAFSNKQEYLDQGFVDASDFANGMELEEAMWNKNISAVYSGNGGGVVYENLKLEEFRDLQGYGLRLPDGSTLLISRYSRSEQMNPVPKGWMFKME